MFVMTISGVWSILNNTNNIIGFMFSYKKPFLENKCNEWLSVTSGENFSFSFIN